MSDHINRAAMVLMDEMSKDGRSGVSYSDCLKYAALVLITARPERDAEQRRIGGHHGYLVGWNAGSACDFGPNPFNE